MKFTLKDYQSDAVKDVLINLGKARKRWHEDKDKHAFSLTATTGAGKTVMAAAVFEALFYGNDDYDIPRDPGAVVVWFSDDPSLNEQSRWRLQESSDMLRVSDLVTVDASFTGETFRPGKVYFLNTQKLSKNSLLVRGHDPNDPDLEKTSDQMIIRPDMRQSTIWDVIRNTIEDERLTLYLVLDEAHRGMKESARGDARPTIVKQLINGTRGVPGIPVVWGISATIQRFNEAIAGMEGRSTLPNVIVDAKKVQESGLLKDTINLDIPGETGDFSTVLLRRATAKLREISQAWAAYAQDQNDKEKVMPLMVVQVPNSPDPQEIGNWIDTIFEEWPELRGDCIANVFGEHATETFGRYQVPYLAPERVQESTWVRVLIAKDAISTGWDCPRAEVMVSLRGAADKTYITQLLGRMVRTPLARRIPGNERLNAVDCLLPKFDRSAVEAVVAELTTGSEAGDGLLGRRVLINAREMLPNPAIPDDVWEKFVSLPSQTLPKKQASPVKRLTALAHELAFDKLLPGAGKKAHAELHKTLDAIAKRYDADIKAARKAVLTVEGMTVKAQMGSGAMSFDDFVEAADMAVIEEAYRAAQRILSPDVAKSYSEYLVRDIDDEEDEIEALMDAHAHIAAMGLVPTIKSDLEAAAEKLTNQWLQQYHQDIKKLSDERQDVYREIREMSAKPLDVDLARPSTRLQPTTIRTEGGKEVPLPRYPKHLLCDSEGQFPCELNAMEKRVLETELKRADLLGWYRNPSTPSQDSLGITYEDDGQPSIVRPDFIFFYRGKGKKVVTDIIDPHSIHLADAFPKLKGLARYAEAHPDTYGRIAPCDEIDGELRSLDLTEKTNRNVVLGSGSIQNAYRDVGRIL